MDSISNLIQIKARELDLALIGITEPSQPVHFTLFEKWLSQKRFGDMAYLNDLRSLKFRKNPSLLMPVCRSIIVVGLPYSVSIPSDNKAHGKIASYALKDDYHFVIREKLNKLLAYINEISNLEVKGSIFCDSAPILEKEMAQRAGLGWIGKNSLLISSQFGSFMNLGELFLDIELPQSPIINEDLCGDCHLCIDACPTQCIQTNRTLNAERCISYLTVEYKGRIDRHLRSMLDSWVFGCDICQIICPYNKEIISKSNFENSEKDPLRNKFKIKDFSEKEFFLKFGNSPIKRIKRNGILRNYTLFLGNSGSSESISDLKLLSKENDPVIRIYSAWALGRLKSPYIKNILENNLMQEKNLNVIEEINHSLSALN